MLKDRHQENGPGTGRRLERPEEKEAGELGTRPSTPAVRPKTGPETPRVVQLSRKQTGSIIISRATPR